MTHSIHMTIDAMLAATFGSTEIIRIAPEPLSLETPVGEEEDSHLCDFVQDDENCTPSEAASRTRAWVTPPATTSSGP